ncbi:FtsH protease activity modulator HflK [Ectothiorhodospiraceae bacterium BW-2]|nr:FtsH protease activity modulator HflK [Ectothiorhodospiraceae bacterium BW-2]
MAWNEPGGSNRDPWGQGGGGSGEGPPDLDEIVRKLQQRFSSLLGGRAGGSGKEDNNGSDGGGGGRLGRIGASLIAIVVALIWFVSGLYIVEEGYRGVVLQLGSYQSTTEPGLHWYPRLLQTVEQVDVSSIRSAKLGYQTSEGLMLTQDENIIDIKFDVQYQIKPSPIAARDFLFNVRGIDGRMASHEERLQRLLQDATASAVREVIGRSSMDFILTEGRSPVTIQAQQILQETLDLYQTGLNIIQLTMQDAQAPQQVKQAFDDVVKAREDSVRFQNEAEAYANNVLPEARGKAARIVAEASAYKEQVVAESEGRTSRFNQLLAEYKQEPQVMRTRLYLDTMQSVLSRSSKVMIDVEGGNNMVYLPLDQLRRSATTADSETMRQTMELLSQMGEGSQSGRSTEERLRDTLRRREVR